LSRYLCDTTCLVAAVSSWHEHHERTLAELDRRSNRQDQLVLAAHSLAETYSVLTRLPAARRLRAADALATIEANWRSAPTVHLTATETWTALEEAVRLGAVGGRTYDALIARAAIKARADTILTWNVRDFAPFAAQIRIEAPD
jgi:predicted nucleic acid-binding protein